MPWLLALAGTVGSGVAAGAGAAAGAAGTAAGALGSAATAAAPAALGALKTAGGGALTGLKAAGGGALTGLKTAGGGLKSFGQGILGSTSQALPAGVQGPAQAGSGFLGTIQRGFGGGTGAFKPFSLSPSGTGNLFGSIGGQEIIKSMAQGGIPGPSRSAFGSQPNQNNQADQLLRLLLNNMRQDI